MNRNLLYISLFFSLWFFVIIIFLAYLQIYKYEYYFNKSSHLEKSKIIPRRGSLYDRNGNILAGSYEDYTGLIALDTKNYNYTNEALEKIKSILNLSDKILKDAIEAKSGYFVLKSKEDIRKIKELERQKIPGLILEKAYKRVYPYSELLSHIIGWVDWKNDGISGVEYFFNDILKGREGEKLILRDSLRYSYDIGEELKHPVPGKDIKMTIDVSIQYKAKKTLENLKEKISFEWGAITIMDPQNGEILAHSIDPPFSEEKKGIWQDEHLASSFYEPGSILKPFFAEKAIRLKLVELNNKFDCSKGYVEIGKIKINDHHRFGILNFSETLYFSSNVGCILWSLRIPPKEFFETIDEYGFLRKTGIEIPSEVKGRIINSNSQISQAYITLGQGISVTSAQILRAYSSLINGGILVRPHLIVGNNFKEKLPFKPEYETLKSVLFQTIIEGTGKKAYISFIPMAGKTGTAQIAEGGSYVKGSYISSFVCWFPLEEPRYLILIVIKKPKPLYYGGDVAAPLARNISLYLFLKGQENEII